MNEVAQLQNAFPNAFKLTPSDRDPPGSWPEYSLVRLELKGQALDVTALSCEGEWSHVTLLHG